MESKHSMEDEKDSNRQNEDIDDKVASDFCVCTCPDGTCCGNESCCGCGGSLMQEEVFSATKQPDQDTIIPSENGSDESRRGACALGGSQSATSGRDESTNQRKRDVATRSDEETTATVDMDSSENHLPGAHAVGGPEGETEPAGDIEVATEEMHDQSYDGENGIRTLQEVLDSGDPTPMLEAELVQSHVDAVRVQIDEVVAVAGEEIHRQHFLDDPFQKGGQRGQRFIKRRRFWLIVGTLLLVVVVLAITVGVLVGTSKNSRDESASFDDEITPTSSPSFDYACYSSTLDLLRAQRREDFNRTEPMILCPNTRIQVGRFANPVLNDSSFVDGDYPITVLHDDVTIQCGRDGRRGNNCLLEGGALQVVIQAFVPSPGQGFVINGTVNNATVKGVTFTGQLETVAPLVTASVTVGIGGQNIVFEDCLWANITSPKSLVLVGLTDYEKANGYALDRRSAHVTWSNCAFENIVYGAHLIYAERQAIHIEQTTFRDIRLSSFMISCDQFNPGGFCAGLLYCFDGASCSISNVCVDGFEVDGRSMIYISNDTDWTARGSNVAQNVESPDPLCEFAITEGEGVDGSFYCSPEPVFEKGNDGCRATDDEWPTQPPTLPYECFTSTLDLFEAQRDPLFQIDGPLVICPNTTITIGQFASPLNEDYRVVGGDYPIIALHSNLTVQCGIDGRQDNNCVIDGGFLQVMTQKSLPSPEGGMELNATSIDNFVVQGMTFTGHLESVAPFDPISVLIGLPGTAVLEDCLWTNMTTTNGLIGVGQSEFEDYSGFDHDKRVSQLTMKNCDFVDVRYDFPLIVTHGQAIALVQCTFRNIVLGSLLQDCDFFNPGGKCAGLFYCYDGATCSIEDICLDGFEMEGRSLIYIGGETDWTVSGYNSLGGTEVACELAFTEGVEWDGSYECSAMPLFEASSDGC